MNCRFTCTVSNRTVKNQTDYMTASRLCKKWPKNCRSYHSTEYVTDHFLVMMQLVFLTVGNKNLRWRKTTEPKCVDDQRLMSCRNLSDGFKAVSGGRFAPVMEKHYSDADVLYNVSKSLTECSNASSWMQTKMTNWSTTFRNNRYLPKKKTEERPRIFFFSDPTLINKQWHKEADGWKMKKMKEEF